MKNKQKDAFLQKKGEQEPPPEVYEVELSRKDIDNLEALLQYCSDEVEHNDFVDHLVENVEGDTSDWEDWESMDGIPEELLLEFDGVSSHIYRSSMLLYKVVAPLIRQRDLDLQEKYSARATE